MALEKRNQLLSDLYMMVRKEAIQFEPKDRVRLGQSTDRSNFYIGGVVFHQDSGTLRFTVFDDKGLVVVPQRTPYTLERLSTGDLASLREKVSLYVEKALFRAKHISLISDCLNDSQDEVIYFNTKPQCIVDIHKNGHFEVASFESIRRSFGEIMLTGLIEGKLQYNYSLNELTDTGVSSVASCLGLELTKGQDFGRHKIVVEKERPSRNEKQKMSL